VEFNIDESVASLKIVEHDQSRHDVFQIGVVSD